MGSILIESKKDNRVKDGISLKHLTLAFKILSLNIKMALAGVASWSERWCALKGLRFDP